MISNEEKQRNYAAQFRRLKKALDNEFYLEAIMIEYAIMEDRVEAILSYEGNEIIPQNERQFITFTRKKNKIESLSSKGSAIGRYFSDGFLSRVKIWVDSRNSVVHALLKQNITTEELREYAEQGEELCKELRNRANNYKRYVQRRNEKIN